MRARPHLVAVALKDLYSHNYTTGKVDIHGDQYKQLDTEGQPQQ